MTEQTETKAAGTVLEQLQDILLDSEDIRQYLHQLSTYAADLLSVHGVEVFAAVTLIRDRKPTTVASSGPEAQQLDEVQYRFEEGPCLTAARTGRTVHIPHIADPSVPFPYREAMQAHGISTVLAVPILLEGSAVSALNLYAAEAEVFGDRVLSSAQKLAEDAAKSLHLALRAATLSEAGHDLRAAMESRTTIDIAVGILMGQSRCSQDRAMEMLRSASSTRNLKLRDVAQTVITSVTEEPVATQFDH